MYDGKACRQQWLRGAADVLETGTDRLVEDRANIVPLLHAFAEDFLGVNYMFWVNQEPYFAEDVLPCFGD